MIIEKYGKIKPSCRFAGKRVVCRKCNSVLIFQANDECRKVAPESYGWETEFDCPFCGDKEWGDIYKNKALEFIEIHKLTHKVYHWWRVEHWRLFGVFICCALLGGLGWLVWWLIDTDHKLDEQYRYCIKVHHHKYSDIYRTNGYTMGDDYIEFYIKDDQEKHIIVMKGDNVTITDHLKEENKNGD